MGSGENLRLGENFGLNICGLGEYVKLGENFVLGKIFVLVLSSKLRGKF